MFGAGSSEFPGIGVHRRFESVRRIEFAAGLPVIDSGAVRDTLRLPPLGHVNYFFQGGHHGAHPAVSPRWLTALAALAAIASILIFGALRTLGSGSHFASEPIFFRHASATISHRTDRLAFARHAAGSIRRSQLEQLDDTGSVTTRFTHVVAHLAGFSGVPVAAAASDAPTEKVPSLPRQILAGSVTAAFPPNISSYAQPEDKSFPLMAAEGEAINASTIAELPPRKPVAPRVIIARSGDTLRRILQILGAADQDAEPVASLLTPRGWLHSGAFAGGEKITVLADDADTSRAPGHLLKVSIEQQGRRTAAVARTDAGGFVPVAWSDDAGRPGSETSPDAANQLRTSAGESIRDGLYGMAQASGIDHALIDEIVRLSEREIDLDADLSAADTLELLYRNNDLGEPELAFSELTLDGHPHRYYRFTTADDNSTDYYDAGGHSVTQSLLRKPVAAGRLGDGFGWRMHPVLGVRRMHEGVDYTAPFGSPIAAAAAGVVELISEEAGYGKYVRIRHDLGYETTYAHISAVTHGLHVGQRVRQGETIAFVGSTGYSTGAHLYYEVRINGRNVDPLRVKLRAGRILDGTALASFVAGRDRTDTLLKASSVRDNPG
jgi:murein DD-endopeptidase MepM/ murein hydrolase activator NlpD